MLQGLYFNATADTPIQVPIMTTIPQTENAVSRRFPALESVLGPHVVLKERYAVSYDEQGRAHRFLVAYREDENASANRALRHLLPEIAFYGELVVMQAGVRVLVVDMAGRKAWTLAERAVRRYVCGLAIWCGL